MPPPLRVLTRGSILVGKHGQRYVLLDPLVQRKGKQCNVWSAIKQDNPIHQFVLKKPDDEDGPGWPDFTQEMEMQKLLYKSGYIRRMVDIIPPYSVIGIEPLIMVLEAFEKSLWTARLRRPFTLGEIRSIMRSIAIGLSTIHHNNIVYTDLKMENILVNGFDNETPGSGEHLVTKIADLGMMRPPSQGPISAITYRSPEVYFKKPWTTATDIWSWGIVYLHLLQAHVNFEEPGIFDSLKVEGTLVDKENTIRAAMAQELDLHTIEYYNSDPDTRQLLPPKDETRTELDHWVVKLINKDIPEKDIETVHVVLNPVPELRPSALELLEYGYI